MPSLTLRAFSLIWSLHSTLLPCDFLQTSAARSACVILSCKWPGVLCPLSVSPFSRSSWDYSLPPLFFSQMLIKLSPNVLLDISLSSFIKLTKNLKEGTPISPVTYYVYSLPLVPYWSEETFLHASQKKKKSSTNRFIYCFPLAKKITKACCCQWEFSQGSLGFRSIVYIQYQATRFYVICPVRLVPT